MARDRVYVSEQFKNTMDELKKADVLGLSLAEGKEVFMLSVALGLDKPAPLKNRVGLFLNTALKTADKALIASALLGTMADGDDMDQYADFDKSCELCDNVLKLDTKFYLRSITMQDAMKNCLSVECCLNSICYTPKMF